MPAPRLPSSLDYACRVSPLAAQPGLTALRAWWGDVLGIPHHASDPAVAAAKLGWWRGELQAVGAGRPAQHPLLQTLREHAPGLPPGFLLAVVEAAEDEARQTRLLDEAALLRRAQAQAGEPMAAAAWIVSAACKLPQQAERAAAWSAVGQACALVVMLREVGRDARAGRLKVPISDLQQAGLKAHELLAGTPDLVRDPRYQAVMVQQARRARRLLSDALAALRHTTPRRASRGARVLARLHLALLDQLERSGFPVLDAHVMLSPVRRAWIAAWTR